MLKFLENEFTMMCILNIVYFLGLSVAVDVFTLVCISIERYLAICRPLLSIKLQSNHFSTLCNGLILIGIWLLGLLIALPNFYLYNLCSLPNPGRFKCEKIAVQEFDERYYMIALDGKNQMKHFSIKTNDVLYFS